MIDWKYPLRQIEILLNDKDFKWELTAYKRAYQRLRVRLRNSNPIAKLKVIILANRKLSFDFPVALFQSYQRSIENNTGKKRAKSLRRLKILTAQLVKFIDETLDKTVQTYCGTQSQFKVGHLVHHWIVLRSSIARLRIFYKALLVYASDLYLDIPSPPATILPTEAVRDTLLRHDCKPRFEHQNSSNSGDKIEIVQAAGPSEQVVGQLIDRSSMRPIT